MCRSGRSDPQSRVPPLAYKTKSLQMSLGSENAQGRQGAAEHVRAQAHRREDLKKELNADDPGILTTMDKIDDAALAIQTYMSFVHSEAGGSSLTDSAPSAQE